MALIPQPTCAQVRLLDTVPRGGVWKAVAGGLVAERVIRSRGPVCRVAIGDRAASKGVPLNKSEGSPMAMLGYGFSHAMVIMAKQ